MDPPTVPKPINLVVSSVSASHRIPSNRRKRRRRTSGRFVKKRKACSSRPCGRSAGNGYSTDTVQANWHVHERDGILICDRFLLGECPAGLLCIHHHVPWPYYWQLRLKTSKEWVSLGPVAQEHLERHYCNVKTEHVTLLDSDGSLIQMDMRFLSLTHGKYDLARRLCNSSDPSINPYFPAKWRFYWMELGKWKDYEESISEQLNLAFELGAWIHAFEIFGRLYCVSLKKFNQRNVKTGFTREVRRRPIYRSYQSMAPYLRTVTENDPSTLPDSNNDNGLYPSTWETQLWSPDETFLKVPLRRTEREFIDVESQFFQTMSKDSVLVCSIQRIQNKFLWQKYTCQKEFMFGGLNDAEKTSLERHLFHGTAKDVVDQICQQNFDPRLSGVHGTSYGKGSYFALNASYSHMYSRRSEEGYHYMFMAKVLTGKMALGDATYRRPPKLPSSYTLYDCCVNNLLNPEIFVVYDSCHCYPFFLIQYKLLSESILVTE